MSDMNIISQIQGKAIPVRGNDIDTDRIIPARFLKCVVFDGLGEHVFEDDRLQLKEKGQVHSFDNPLHSGSRILFVNKNFGCGSSREHAPQAILRWGIKAIVGESFAEIFFGNCVSLGIPCLTGTQEQLQQLQTKAEAGAEWKLDLTTQTLSGPVDMTLDIPSGPKAQFLSGKWNSMNELLTAQQQIAEVSLRLPYVSGVWG